MRHFAERSLQLKEAAQKIVFIYVKVYSSLVQNNM